MRPSLFVLFLAACTSDSVDDTDVDTGVDPDGVYAFEVDGTSTVVYTGQVFRHTLIHDLTAEIDGLTERIDGGTYLPANGDVVSDLDFYLEFDGAIGGVVPHGISTDPAPQQTLYSDIASGNDLVGKIAGNDATGQHEDWTTALIGWDDDDVTTPESLVRLWIDQLDALAADRAAGNGAVWPDGSPIEPVYVTEEGQDLKQLVQKFLLGAVAYSQGADDYLDDDIDGKGILSDNIELVEDRPYTALEHAWDEGFGYFGATRQFADLTDDEVADIGYADHNGDGAIDLHSEYVFGHAANAAKRDRGAVVPTDFTQQAYDAFLHGRALIHNADGALSDEELAELTAHRDAALDAWERAIASTAVHYINDTLQDMSKMGADDYSPADHAKHWSELKGFALALQFNPHSQISDADLETLHDLIGTAPTLDVAGVQQARTDLLAARTLLGTSYAFDDDNLGNEDGTNGW